MQTKANGIGINYQIDGNAGPWLVLSNSLATDLSMWDQQAKDFASSFRVLRYDQRGHGKTEAPAGRYSFDMLIADALALMDALDIKRANFCGLSMGGATALGLAQRHPGRIERAIVADSGCASTPQSAQQWEERIAAAQKGGMEPLVEPTVTRWFPADVVAKNPPYLDRARAMIRNTPVNGFIGCSAALADHDFRSAVASTKPPVLFLAGEKDAGGAVPAAMKAMHQELAGSRYVELAGAGHISNLDDPAGFTRALKGFLSAD
ncbi:MAG: 3-oxoadipate enol-lactonase [Hyphomicrobiales bacterium]|jgi:3-oxoadipate enol-lactonase|nr:3-oxoadipate enol-lactonase [Hyphomicrobiales bacterium]